MGLNLSNLCLLPQFPDQLPSPPTSGEPCTNSLASQQYLHAKNMGGSQLSIPTNICCYKSIWKQYAPLTFNISVLGLLIHFEAVINVTEMQIRAAALLEAVKVSSQFPVTACILLCPRGTAQTPSVPASFYFHHPYLTFLFFLTCLIDWALLLWQLPQQAVTCYARRKL